MTQWKRDTRPENVRTFGDFKVYSEVNSDRETAHVVRFPDGRELRVLPDERGGKKRSGLVRAAVEHLASAVEANTAISYETYLYGLLLKSGFNSWEWTADGEVSIEEWLESWFANDLPGRGPADFMAECLLGAIQDDGWAIVREDYIRDLEAE